MSLSIAETLAGCRDNGKKALMPFLTSGYPDGTAFVKLMSVMADSGADLIEVGIPFSDPLADGRTIQQSSQIALHNGVNIDRTFEYIARLNDFVIPIILMSYFNPIYHYGVNTFLKRASELGIKGLIIPDMIPEEGAAMEALSQKYRIDLVYLLAPTSNHKRTELILNRSHGFVYLVSIAGVTGARQSLPANLSAWIKAVKRRSSLPVCVGFGVSNVKQARMVSRHADGVIIGSAIIDKISQAPNRREIFKRTGDFIKQLKEGLQHD